MPAPAPPTVYLYPTLRLPNGRPQATPDKRTARELIAPCFQRKCLFRTSREARSPTDVANARSSITDIDGSHTSHTQTKLDNRLSASLSDRHDAGSVTVLPRQLQRTAPYSCVCPDGCPACARVSSSWTRGKVAFISLRAELLSNSRGRTVVLVTPSPFGMLYSPEIAARPRFMSVTCRRGRIA